MLIPYEVEAMVFLNNLSPTLLKIAQIISDSLYIMIPLVIVLILLKNRKKLYQSIGIILIATIIATILKQFIFEARPYLSIDKLKIISLDVPPTDSSFPSRHAMTSFTAAAVGEKISKYYTLGFYIWAILIALSRVILGVHYIHDVIIGALIGYAVGKILTNENILKRITKIIHVKGG